MAPAPQTSEEAEPLASGSAQDGDFIASSIFTGRREGFVFRKGSRGMGFYRDLPLPSPPAAVSVQDTTVLDSLMDELD